MKRQLEGKPDTSNEVPSELQQVTDLCGDKLAALLLMLREDKRLGLKVVVACQCRSVYFEISYLLQMEEDAGRLKYEHLDSTEYVQRAGRGHQGVRKRSWRTDEDQPVVESVHYGLKPRQLSERCRVLRRFREDPSLSILILNASQDREIRGIDLQCARKMYVVDHIANESRRRQLLHRVHRLGKAQPSEIVYLVARNTMEDDVHQKYIVNMDGPETVWKALLPPNHTSEEEPMGGTPDWKQQSEPPEAEMIQSLRRMARRSEVLLW